MKKVYNYENKKNIIVKENDTPEHMTEEQRHREKNKKNLLEKGRVCNGKNKERPQQMVCD